MFELWLASRHIFSCFVEGWMGAVQFSKCFWSVSIAIYSIRYIILKKTRREEALSDAEGVTYEAGGFWYARGTSGETIRLTSLKSVRKNSDSCLKTLTLVLSEYTFSIFEKRYLKLYLINFAEIFRAYSLVCAVLNEHREFLYLVWNAFYDKKYSRRNPCKLCTSAASTRFITQKTSMLI